MIDQGRRDCAVCGWPIVTREQRLAHVEAKADDPAHYGEPEPDVSGQREEER